MQSGSAARDEGGSVSGKRRQRQYTRRPLLQAINGIKSDRGEDGRRYRGRAADSAVVDGGEVGSFAGRGRLEEKKDRLRAVRQREREEGKAKKEKNNNENDDDDDQSAAGKRLTDGQTHDEESDKKAPLFEDSKTAFVDPKVWSRLT